MRGQRVAPDRFWLLFCGLWLGVGLPFLAIGVGAGIQGRKLEQRFAREGRVPVIFSVVGGILATLGASILFFLRRRRRARARRAR